MTFPVPTLNNRDFINSLNNIGVAPTGVTADEFGDGFHHVTKLTFTNFQVGAGPVAGAALGFGQLIYTTPLGGLEMKSALIKGAFTGSTNIVGDNPIAGIGSVVASGAVAVLSGTATFENLMTGAASGVASGANTYENVAAKSLPRKSTDVKSVFLNLAATWAGAGTVTFTGVITLQWVSFNP